jgi:hypothetical protein
MYAAIETERLLRQMRVLMRWARPTIVRTVARGIVERV